MAESLPPLPTLLEQLGALGSLLIHDTANHMCIVSGNATFAQMVLQDPVQVAKAVDAIAKSGERLSFVLERCGDLRRQLGENLPRGEVTAAVAAVRQLLTEHPGWTLEIGSAPTAPTLVPTPWIAFAVRQVVVEAGVDKGTIRARPVKPDSDTAFLLPFGGAYYEFRFKWESEKAFSIEEARQRYENLGLLACFELIRQCGGKLEGYTPAPAVQEAVVIIPIAVG